MKVRTLAKGQHLTRQGEPSQALYFVRSGLIRYYYLADGVEHTGQFFDEGTVVADVHALLTGGSGLQNIDALEPSVVLEIPRSALQMAFDEDHALERTGRRWMEEGMAGSQRRIPMRMSNRLLGTSNAVYMMNRTVLAIPVSMLIPPTAMMVPAGAVNGIKKLPLASVTTPLSFSARSAIPFLLVSM